MEQRHQSVSNDECPDEIARQDQLERTPVKHSRRDRYVREIPEVADGAAYHAGRNGAEPQALDGAHQRAARLRGGQLEPGEIADFPAKYRAPLAAQPRKQVADSGSRTGQTDPHPVQQAEYRDCRTESAVELEGPPMPVANPEARPGRDMHDAREREIDYYGQGERGMEPKGDDIEFRLRAAAGRGATHDRPRWLLLAPAMKAASVESNTAGWSKKTAWAAWRIITKRPAGRLAAIRF